MISYFFQFPNTEQDCIDIVDEIETKWQFSRCFDATDGKNVGIVAPS